MNLATFVASFSPTALLRGSRAGRAACVAGLAAAALVPMALAGPLNPPNGPVSSTGRTVQEIYDKVAAVSTQVSTAEPRIAVNATNTPGGVSDVYIINQPGSYYLTANLLAVGGKRGILINASHVTLDLNGFAVRGNGSATLGITTGVGQSAIVIRNGIVENWMSAGVGTNSLIDGIVIERLVARGNGTGISMSANSGVVSECVSIANTGAGFSVSAGGRINNCTASGNGGLGFDLGNSVVARGCMARNNTGGGYQLSDNAECYDSHAVGNTGDGFQAFWACNIVRCTAIVNGGWGISVQRHCRVQDCFTRANNGASFGGIGLLDIDTVCEGNTCQANSRGIVASGASNTIVRNRCIASTSSNFVLVANNKVGTIINPTNSAAVNGNSGGGLGTTDPMANFAY